MKNKFFLVIIAVVVISLTGVLTYGRYSVHKETPPQKATSVEKEAFQQGYSHELDELKHIITRYSTDLFLSGEIAWYEEKNGSWERTEKKSFSSIVAGASACFAVDSIVTLQDNGIAVMVDHMEKMIIVKDMQDADVPSVTGNMLPLEELAANMERISLQRTGETGLLTLRLKPEAAGTFNACEIQYRVSDYKLLKITYSGAEQDLIAANEATEEELSAYGEVVLEDGMGGDMESGYLAKGTAIKLEMIYKEERKPHRNETDAGKYVTKAGDEYVPAPAYRNYMIHN